MKFTIQFLDLTRHISSAHSHMWQVVTVLDRAGVEQSHHWQAVLDNTDKQFPGFLRKRNIDIIKECIYDKNNWK